jgi:large subunit ribosomal protein LP0
MATRAYSQRKQTYYAQLTSYLTEFKTCIIVHADNVGSNQLQKVRILLRNSPKGYVLMGKNTLARNCIRAAAAENEKLNALLPLVVGNIGFVFTNDDAKAVRDLVLSVRVPAAAKAGAASPVDVFVPPGPTGLDPSQTNFFQALNIATKIVKGAIEIISEVHLLKPGDKVDTSKVALLNKLNIRPFSYGLKIVKVYEDGATYDSSVLDLTADALLTKFFNGVSKVAAVSLAIKYPTAASLPHLVAAAYKNLLAIALTTAYTFPEAEKFKAGAAAGAAAASAAPAASKAAAPAAKVVAKVEEPEEDALDGGFSMFD